MSDTQSLSVSHMTGFIIQASLGISSRVGFFEQGQEDQGHFVFFA